MLTQFFGHGHTQPLLCSAYSHSSMMTHPYGEHYSCRHRDARCVLANQSLQKSHPRLSRCSE